MHVKEEIKLSEYMRDKRNVHPNFAEDYVSWKDECYRLVYKDEVPYVQIREILKLSEITKMVRKINEFNNKRNLKGNTFTINGNMYYIEGIGGEAIKASKNGAPAKFYRYTGPRNIEGQELLEVLYNHC